MPAITAELVKKLRDETNVSMMECKRALVEAGGDLAQATLILRKRGVAIAANKATRSANQGLIPAKTLAFDEGVNVTLGLPFVRTSPDHGTAFDIAGQGVARPASLLAALALADRLTR